MQSTEIKNKLRGGVLRMDNGNQKRVENHREQILENGKLTMSTKEVAEILGIGMNTVYTLFHKEGFPAIKVGNKYLTVKSKLFEWLENNIGSELSNRN